MTKITTAVSLLAAGMFALSSSAFAGAKDYQVTGPVLEVNDSMIAVQKGKDRWEIDRNSSTKSEGGDVKVGDKVTVHYTMTATSIEAKAAAKSDKKADKKGKKDAAAASDMKAAASPAASPK